MTILSSNLSGFVSSIILNPYCIVLDNYIFEKFILANEPFAKYLRTFETCVSINNKNNDNNNNNNLRGELVSSLEFLIRFDERVKVIIY